MAQFAIITATAVLLVSATVVVHAIGSYAVIRDLVRYAVDVEGHFKPHKGLLSVIGSATFLLLLHVVEIQSQ